MQWSLTIAVSTACFLCGWLGPVQADEATPKLHDAEVLREFNRFVEAGDLERAESLARDAFLQSSSNPQAVLMVRQVFLMQKLQDASRTAASTTPPKSWSELTALRRLKVSSSKAAVQSHSKNDAADPFADVSEQAKNSRFLGVITLGNGTNVAVSEDDFSQAAELTRTKANPNPVSDSQKLREELQSRVFAVADLVVPVTPIVVSPVNGIAQFGTTWKGASILHDECVDAESSPILRGAGPHPDAADLQPQYENLINLITHTVEPDSWSSQGGSGNISAYKPSLGLVVRQTPSVQAKIEELLSNLRSQREIQVSVEVVRIDAPHEMFANILRSIKDSADCSAESECTECPATLSKVSGTLAAANTNTNTNDAAESCAVCEIGRKLVQSLTKTSSGVKSGKPVHGTVKLTLSLNPGTMTKSLSANYGSVNSLYSSRSNILLAAISGATWVVSPWNTPSVLARIGCVERKTVPAPQTTWISASERTRLLDSLQSNAHGNVRYMPKMTLMNGQTAAVSADGQMLQLQGTVGPDRKRVRLTVRLASDKTDASASASVKDSASTINLALNSGEAILIPAPPLPGKAGQRSKFTSMYLVTARILAVQETATDTSLGLNEEVQKLDEELQILFPPPSTSRERSMSSLMETLYGQDAIQERRMQTGVGVPPPAKAAPLTDEQPKYFRSGGIEIRR